MTDWSCRFQQVSLRKSLAIHRNALQLQAISISERRRHFVFFRIPTHRQRAVHPCAIIKSSASEDRPCPRATYFCIRSGGWFLADWCALIVSEFLRSANRPGGRSATRSIHGLDPYAEGIMRLVFDPDYVYLHLKNPFHFWRFVQIVGFNFRPNLHRVT